ncbi:hypothetical protein LTR99_007572 [Exophiala xenobiotica]|uniref:Uncharacterized protein n=1 Tax=Vermiconidia calcicola TaxID=1690605 RepID=A0AAV9Q7B6_9PEZI|nr:hypothetical protein H2202_001629 [Exophiala xenobiotica]KAK5529596.1 hypothetical protein LTR23_010663 [Chaetothyriales sp. CCFEE 6169]KAK5534681.1 hypothetical protein LTR25_006713 [Vermiconidia calcicola]KAK5198180.1 hypothetical protein LTR92_002425 [Exophiala xenobiotica]KAK5210511.1 hypothetical protein LTR41_004179 [Exophiala xenobiotica]
MTTPSLSYDHDTTKDMEASVPLISNDMDKSNIEPVQVTAISTSKKVLVYIDTTLDVLFWLVVPLAAIIYFGFAHVTVCKNERLAKSLLGLVGGWICANVKVALNGVLIERPGHDPRLRPFLQKHFDIFFAYFSGLFILAIVHFFYYNECIRSLPPASSPSMMI